MKIGFSFPSTRKALGWGYVTFALFSFESPPNLAIFCVGGDKWVFLIVLVSLSVRKANS